MKRIIIYLSILLIVLLFKHQFLNANTALNFSDVLQPSIINDDTSNIIKIRNNSIYIEALGNSILYSINYERIFLRKNNLIFSFRIGSSFIPMQGYHQKKIIGLPALINGSIRLNNLFFFEFGVGSTLKYMHYFKAPPNPGSFVNEYKFAFSAFAGIKIQQEKGFILRTGIFTPFPKIFYEDSFTLNTYCLPIGGISIGYTF